MSDITFHIRVKKQYAVVLMEYLIKVHAIEVIEQEQSVELSENQRAALDKELVTINTNLTYLQKRDEIKNRFIIP